ncbi:Ropporin-1-like protein [Chytridiales sp. JEL 0842]|nr:Ropporin-1-like protein [Chytridiales sp. JEL 0842]
MTPQPTSTATAEPLYCAEQIKIPPELPDILKNYTKHIIRTQPTDIIGSSAEYFGRLAKQRNVVGKKITNMQLESFYNKFSSSDKQMVTKKEIDDACNHAGVINSQVSDIMTLGGWSGDKIPWLKFWALLAAAASGTLVATIETVTQLLGDNGTIPTGPVTEVFQFLADRDPSQEKAKTANVIKALQAAG